MPMRWEPPELFLEHKGRKVYFTYDEDNPDAVQVFWYTTDQSENEAAKDDYTFDVRDLFLRLPKSQRDTLNPQHTENHPAIIREAIDRGRLSFPETDESESAEEWRTTDEAFRALYKEMLDYIRTVAASAGPGADDGERGLVRRAYAALKAVTQQPDERIEAWLKEGEPHE